MSYIFTVMNTVCCCARSYRHSTDNLTVRSQTQDRHCVITLPAFLLSETENTIKQFALFFMHPFHPHPNPTSRVWRHFSREFTPVVWAGLSQFEVTTHFQSPFLLLCPPTPPIPPVIPAQLTKLDYKYKHALEKSTWKGRRGFCVLPLVARSCTHRNCDLSLCLWVQQEWKLMLLVEQN